MAQRNISVRDIRTLVREALGEWVVRSGVEVLVRPERGSPSEWRAVVLDKVLYFSNDNLVRGPSSQVREQVWTFRRGDALYAISDDQFLSRPTWKRYAKQRSW